MTRFLSSRQCETALDLAERGYSVFPCKERGKAPLTATGFKAAVRDERQILTWWDRWPDANIGVACEASGITVVDIDTKAGADPSEHLATLATLGDGPLTISWTGEAPPPCPEYPDSLTGDRGAHAWYRGLTKTGHTSWPGVELRSRGAYVLAPGSVHPSGVRYRWVGGATAVPPRVNDLPDLPGELHAGGGVNGEAKNWGVTPPPDAPLTVSERHDGLVFLAGTLIARRVFEPDLIAGALLEANRVRCQPPKSEQEVRAIANWAAESDTATTGRVEQELARRLFKAWRTQDGQPAS